VFFVFDLVISLRHQLFPAGARAGAYLLRSVLPGSERNDHMGNGTKFPGSLSRMCKGLSGENIPSRISSNLSSVLSSSNLSITVPKVAGRFAPPGRRFFRPNRCYKTCGIPPKSLACHAAGSSPVTPANL